MSLSPTIFCARLSLALLLACPLVGRDAKPGAGATDATHMERLHTARKLGNAGRWAEALWTEINPVIEHYEAAYAGETRRIYCCRTEQEVLASLLKAASENANAVAIGPVWAMAYFMKAYALIELGRTAEARLPLERAIELAPFNSQYLSEKAHLLQSERRWADSQAIFVRAEECARAYTPSDERTSEVTRALRGQGYNLVELGDFEAAARKYEECLQLDPNDRGAREELAYVRQQIAGRRRP